MPKPLYWFTPLPPQRNGIADYSAILLAEMAKSRACTVFCEDLATGLPKGVDIADPAQAFRHLAPDSPILHQIGNNGGHVFVLKALRQFGGVVSLHDLSLLYLYELASPRVEDVLGHIRRTTGALGSAYVRHWEENGIKTAANYVLFDLVGEILSHARKVIVHSHYARNKLAAIHGHSAADKTVVIPHFAPKLRAGARDAERQKTAVYRQTPLILTSGFATRAKRFDWIVDALDGLARAGLAFHWIHAGEERAEEFDLSGAIKTRPALVDRSKITGYLSEEMLDGYIAAADIVINLRFPSVGESSGTLARAFSAGCCCIVSDTAAYSEIPRDAVIHVPVFDTVAALSRALEALIGSPELRAILGSRAKIFAETELSLASVAARYLDCIDDAYRPLKSRRGKTSVAATAPGGPDAEPRMHEVRLRSADELELAVAEFARSPGEFELRVWFDSAETFAAAVMENSALLRDAVAPHVSVETLRFVASGAEVGLAVRGISHASGDVC